MSYAGEVKREISKIMPQKHCCKTAELAALLLTCGRLVLKGRMRFEIIVVTMENNVAHKFVELVKQLYDAKIDITVSRNMRLNPSKAYKYSLKLYDSQTVRKMLEDTTIITQKDGVFNISHTDWEKLLICDDCINAFLRGAFAGAGSVNNPERYNHMEFVLYDYDFAVAFAAFLNKRDIHCKMIERKGFYMVYLKEAECIIDVLRACGASKTLFDYENIRIRKEIVNKVNRLMNCDMANQNKTIDSAGQQIADIHYIVDHKGWGYLPDSLREIAECRLNNEEASLSELGELLDPPIGKSGVNHRMKRIRDMARALAQEEVEQSHPADS